MSAMTKLEAVNEMLMAIGQAPVNTLAVAGIRDVSIAEQVLDNVSREVQTEGHSFNTFEQELTPDVNGRIAVGSDILRIDASRNVAKGGEPYRRVIPLYETGGAFLYDQDEGTDVFDGPIRVEVVRLLDFENIPQHARRYIVAMAKLRFQASVVGSDQLNRLIEQEVGLAYAAFRKVEHLQRDNNFFKGGSTRISRGRHRLRRYV